MSENSSSELVATTPPSPYRLHPSDNPGALISSVILKEDNYSEWATELKNSLQAKHKLGFIDGSTQKPSTEPDLSMWRAANSMTVGWIRTSIDPKLRSTVSFIAEASTLWETLRSRFSVGNGVRKQVLKDEIAGCKQNGQTVLEYYGRLSKLWEELQQYKTGCDCTCAAAPAIAKEREDDQVHQFLFGLDLPRFSNIRSTIAGEDPKPPLTQVYSRVIREEQNLNVALFKETAKTEAIDFTVKTESPAQAAAVSRPRFRDRSTLSCTHCRRQGHDISECFLLHGFPDWYHEHKGDTNQPIRSVQRGGRPTRGFGRRRGRANNARVETSSENGNNQITQLINLPESQRSNTSSEKLSGLEKMEGPRTEKAAMAATSVFWDINNCPVPAGVGAREVAPRIKQFLKSLGYFGPLTITAVGTLTGLPKRVVQGFSSTGIVLQHGIRAHVNMREVLFAWISSNKPQSDKPPSNLFVISPKNSDVLAYLSTQPGFNVIYLPNYDQGPSSSINSLWNNFLLSDADLGPLEEDMCTEIRRESWVCGVCYDVDGHGLDDFWAHLESPLHESYLEDWADGCLGCPDHPRAETWS